MGEPIGAEVDEARDPDPFTIALGLFATVAGGGTFLEARKARQLAEHRQRNEFSAAWYAARRTLIHFKRVLDEFETYVLEDGYGTKAFRIGAVRISVDANRHRALRRLNGQAMTTANFMADNLDDLSEFLGQEDQEGIDKIMRRLEGMTLPETYREVIKLAREATELYSDFLDEIGERQGFARSATD